MRLKAILPGVQVGAPVTHGVDVVGKVVEVNGDEIVLEVEDDTFPEAVFIPGDHVPGYSIVE